MSFCHSYITSSPKSFAIVTLLHKSEATKYPITIAHVGFDIPDKFVVGYGLDYDGLGVTLRKYTNWLLMLDKAPFVLYLFTTDLL
jgi:hypoxanthine-guanine phosphoribosyltransferase